MTSPIQTDTSALKRNPNYRAVFTLDIYRIV